MNTEILTETAAVSGKKPELPPIEQARLWVDAHLPEIQPGEFYAWSKCSRDPNRLDWSREKSPFDNHFCQTKDELIRQALHATQDKDTDVFVSPAVFTCTTRKNDFVARRRAIALDFDVTNPGDSPKEAEKKYENIRDAADAAVRLSTGLGVKISFVKSGRGVHGYVVLDRDYKASELKPVAEQLKSWAKEQGIKIDAQVTGDMSRLMRMPGSVHRKNQKGLKVVLGGIGDPIPLAELEGLIKQSRGKPKASIASKSSYQPVGAGLVIGGKMAPEAPDGLFRSPREMGLKEESFSVSANYGAIRSAIDFLIAKGAQDDGYESWWGVIKDLTGGARATSTSQDEAEFLYGEARRFSEASSFWDEVEFEDKWNDPGIQHGYIKNLLNRAQGLGWKNPGKDSLSRESPSHYEQLMAPDGAKHTAKLSTVIQALGTPGIAGFRLAYDEFAQDEVISEVGQDSWRSLTDADIVQLRVCLEDRCFKTVSRELMRDALTAVTQSNKIDTAKIWAGTLPTWDGTPRIEEFFPNYLKSENTDYARSLGVYFWTAVAGRLLEPGVKADMVPILVGAQGSRKSTAVMELCPSPEAFAELSFATNDENAKRTLRGKLVIELAELAGYQKREIDTLKQFITARFDEWRPNYKERIVRAYRRCVFIGTTNRDDFLRDETGHRRWLPIDVGLADVEKIKRDRDQLWAEAIARFKKDGIVFREVETLARNVHQNYVAHDPIAERITSLMKTPMPPNSLGMPRLWGDRSHFQLEEIMTGLDIRTADFERMKQPVAAAMTKLGFKSKQKRFMPGQPPFRAWVKEEK